MHALLKMLQGGDKRSIGRSNEAAARVAREPALFAVLIDGMLHDDSLLRMRCADAAEKITAAHPEYLAPYKPLLLKHLSKIEEPEVQWHVAPMLARLPLTASEQKAVVTILLAQTNSRSSIVKTFAMQALFDLAARYTTFRPMARRHIEELTRIGTPAMQARGRKLLEQFDRLPMEIRSRNRPLRINHARPRPRE